MGCIGSEPSRNHASAPITSSSGISLIATDATCILPADRVPIRLIAVIRPSRTKAISTPDWVDGSS